MSPKRTPFAASILYEKKQGGRCELRLETGYNIKLTTLSLVT